MATKLTRPRTFGVKLPSRPRRVDGEPRRRRVPTPLRLLLIVAALQSLAWTLSLPAFQGPDERAHFDYIQHLAETGDIPSSTSGHRPTSGEVAAALSTLNLSSLIGDLGARPGWSSADLGLLHQVEEHLPAGSRGNGAGPNAIAKNPPLYYALMGVPYRAFVWLPLLKRVLVLRLFNALCFLATVALTWMLAGELFGPVRWKQTLAAGVVALEPQLAFMSAVINADNLLIATSTAFLLAAVRLVRRGPSVGRAAVAALCSAAAILTHGRGLVTVPVLAVALVVTWLRWKPPARLTVRGGGVAVAAVGAAMLVEYAITRSGGGSLYGGQATLLNSSPFSIGRFVSYAWQFFFPKLWFMAPRIGPDYGYRQMFITTFYATFGSLEVTFKPHVYDLLRALSAIGLGGFVVASVVRWRALMRAWAPVLVMLSMVVTLIVFLLYVAFQALLVDGGSDPLIVGRYLLPMVSLFGVAVAFTVGALPRPVNAVVATVLLSGAVVLALGGIGITAARFYA